MKSLAVLFLIGACFAQTAEVYDLTTTESAEGKRLYTAMMESKDAFDEYSDRMSAKYIRQPRYSCADAAIFIGDDDNLRMHHTACVLGEFDSNFKHILPKTKLTTQPSFQFNGNHWSTPINGTINTPNYQVIPQ